MSLKKIKEKYYLLLKEHFLQPNEQKSFNFSDLGRDLVRAKIQPEEIAELHEEVFLHLSEEFPDVKLLQNIRMISEPLKELLMSCGLAFREQLDKYKKAEEVLHKTNRAYKMLSDCNQALIRATEETELLQEMCRVIVEIGRYRLAWVGFAEEDEKKTVRPVAQRGYEEGYLDTINITWADNKEGRGPTGTAIRTGKPSIIKNILTNPDYTPWRNIASKRGYASSIGLPLIIDRQTLGVLNIYASEPNAFDDEEVDLLMELANDLAFGIMTLRTRVEHKQAEDALRTSKAYMENIITSMTDALFVVAPDATIQTVNNAAITLLGYTEDELIGKSIETVFGEGGKEEVFTELVLSMVKRKLQIIYDNDPEDFWSLLKTAPLGAVIVGSNGKIVMVNEKTESIFGYGKEELIGKMIHVLLPAKLRNLHEKERVGFMASPRPRFMGKGRILTAQRKDGKTFTVEVGLVPLQIDGDTHVVSVIQEPESNVKWEFIKLTRFGRLFSEEEVFWNIDRNLIGKDGKEIPVLMSGAVMRDNSGKIQGAVLVAKDITEQKKKEEELKKAAIYIDAMGDSLLVLNMRREVVKLNRAALGLLGYSQEEIPELTFEKLFPEREHKRHYAEMESAVETGIVRPFETWVLTKDGKEIPVQLSGTALKNARGEPTGFVGVYRDITEHKKTEEELHKRRDENTKLVVIAKERGELQEWINTFDTFVAKFDPNGLGLFFNEAPIIAGGINLDNVVGHYFPDAKWWSHSEIERARIIDCFDRAKAGFASRIETNFRSADGTPVPIIFNCQPVIDDDGKVKYITAEGKTIVKETRLRNELQKAKDDLEIRVRKRTSELLEINKRMEEEITERKLAEERSARFARIFKDSLNEIYLFEADTLKFTQVNSAAQKNLGYTMEELKELTPLDLKPEFTTESFGKLVEPLHKGEKEKIVFETVHKRKDQSHYNVEVHLQYQKYEYETLFTAIILDITERKQAEEELVKYRMHLEDLIKERTAQLEESNQELKDFAYIVSHDLKAPLRAIYQLSYWISKDYEDVIDKEGKRQLALLGKRVKRMDSLIDGILQYSRVGKVREKEKMISFNSLVKDIIASLDVPDNIKIKIVKKLPKYVGDKIRFTQVFQNLISNSIKFIDKPNGKINIGCNDEGKYWKFWVEDNGPGIEEKYFDKVFQIFQTLKSRDEQEGTGVGLTLVKKIVTIYKGEIWLKSTVDEGTTVFFTLPKKDQDTKTKTQKLHKKEE